MHKVFGTINKKLLLLLAALMAATVLYYGLLFQGQLPDHPILQRKNDLFLHLCAFLALTLPVRVLWQHWHSVAALALCAAAIEAIQIFEPRRTADLKDLAASLLGVLAGTIIIALLQRALHRNSKANHE